MFILDYIKENVASMNEQAVRKWLERYQMAMFLIAGRLHSKFDPDTLSGTPQDMVDRLKIKMEALGNFSFDIAEIIDEYKIGYVGNILNKANSPEENLKGWEEYFKDRGIEVNWEGK